MALLWDSRDPVIRTVWEKVYAQQLVRVKDAVCDLYLSPVFLPGQGAITLLCLQRTPDQTITLSGSQTAPKGSDSTDKWALGSPSHWGERDHTPLEQRQQCIRKTSFLQFHYIWWAASTAALLPPSSNFVELKVARNSRGKSNGNVLSSLPTPSLLTLWLWTSSGLTVMIPLRNAPQIHLSSFSPQPLCIRTPTRRKQRLKQRMSERGGGVTGHSNMRWAGTWAAASPQQ